MKIQIKLNQTKGPVYSPRKAKGRKRINLPPPQHTRDLHHANSHISWISRQSEDFFSPEKSSISTDTTPDSDPHHANPLFSPSLPYSTHHLSSIEANGGPSTYLHVLPEISNLFNFGDIILLSNQPTSPSINN